MADAAQLNKKISKGGGDGVEVEGGRKLGNAGLLSMLREHVARILITIFPPY